MIIEHHGVKGMHWGVRRDRSRAGPGRGHASTKTRVKAGLKLGAGVAGIGGGFALALLGAHGAAKMRDVEETLRMQARVDFLNSQIRNTHATMGMTDELINKLLGGVPSPRTSVNDGSEPPPFARVVHPKVNVQGPTVVHPTVTRVTNLNENPGQLSAAVKHLELNSGVRMTPSLIEQIHAVNEQGRIRPIRPPFDFGR